VRGGDSNEASGPEGKKRKKKKKVVDKRGER